MLTECGVRGGDFAMGARRRRTMASIFFSSRARGVMGGGLAVGVSVTGSQRKENPTVLTHGYLVTLSSSIVIVLGIVLKPPIHSSHRAKSTTAKALRIQRNA